MQKAIHTVQISGNDVVVELANFDEKDGQDLKKVFGAWVTLNKLISKFGRKINIPEALSESMFCIFSGSSRYTKKIRGNGSVSFDTYNLKTKEKEQIKASSLEFDLSTFGPKSEWDKLYFMNFYNGGNMNGIFNVYEIPTELVYSNAVNLTQTMKDQQLLGKRPRFSIMKDIILPNKIKPIGKDVKVW
ncbi:MAG: Bsp6I family type II restriction endonuclease [Candidatus Paceibacterota bacterium]